MNGYFDIHSHILPGVDDGAKDMEETTRMLSIAYDEGIRIVVATPHYALGDRNASASKIKELFQEVSQMVKNLGKELQIVLGNELFYSSDIIEALRRGDALTIDGTRYILIEFPLNASYRDIRVGLHHCIISGYIPILAHSERYLNLIKQPELVCGLIEMGTYIQINFSHVKGSRTNPKINFCQKLLKNKWVHFIGTDAHDAYERTPHVIKTINYMKKKYGDDIVKQLLWENPMTMLEDKFI